MLIKNSVGLLVLTYNLANNCFSNLYHKVLCESRSGKLKNYAITKIKLKKNMSYASPN
jgi:hypothetical protein